MVFFNIRPNFHMLAHIFEACWMDEDWVRSVANIARKTHAKKTHHSTLTRYSAGTGFVSHNKIEKIKCLAWQDSNTSLQIWQWLEPQFEILHCGLGLGFVCVNSCCFMFLMSCWFMFFHVIICHVGSCFFMSQYVMLVHVFSCHNMSCWFMFFNVMLAHVFSCHVGSCFFMS